MRMGLRVRQGTEVARGELRESLSIVCLRGVRCVAPLPLLAYLIADDAAYGGSTDSS